MRKQKQIVSLPDEFSTYEEAAEFWDTHDTSDYPEAFRTVEVRSELRQRHYEVEIVADVMKKLRERAKRESVFSSCRANNLIPYAFVGWNVKSENAECCVKLHCLC